jgi:hypothetical protein
MKVQAFDREIWAMNPASDRMARTDRRAAWDAAKVAVRYYAREPSEINADKVERALRRLRRLAAAAPGRRPPAPQVTPRTACSDRPSTK